tara:strand:- start:717 stop:2114 length:1398 start_codon:yes stop_codon:yes gene_type:complete
MLPSVYGCSAQQTSSPPPSIAISTVTFTTVSYGTTLAATPTAIPLSDQIVTPLNAGNSFTVPTAGLAQYYSGSNTSQQVFHKMEVAYTPSNWVEADLPTDGNCQFVFQTTMNEPPAASQLNTWPLEGNVEGGFLPDTAKVDGVRITTTPELDRSQVFLLSPILGEEDFTLLNGVQVLVGGDPAETNATDRLNRIIFAAQNLGSSSSFDLVIKVLLSDGTYVTSPAQTITIPSGAVKTNLVAGLGINSYTTSTAAFGVQNGGGGGNPPVNPIDPSQVLVSALNTANSFTTPNLAGGVGMAQGFQDPPDDPANQVLHSWLLNLDTSPLTLSDYPATNLTVQYVFSWNADATGIGPAEGICWDAETGVPSTVTGPVGSIFTQTIGVEFDSINTNTLIPQASINFPVVGSTDTDYAAAWKAYSPSVGAPVGAPYTVNLQVRIQKTDGSFSESPEITLNITDGGVAPTML